MKSKKVLAILLSLSIMLTFMPTMAFAESGGAYTTCHIGENFYEDLATAYEKAQEGDIIEIDKADAGTVTITTDKLVKVDVGNSGYDIDEIVLGENVCKKTTDDVTNFANHRKPSEEGGVIFNWTFGDYNASAEATVSFRCENGHESPAFPADVTSDPDPVEVDCEKTSKVKYTAEYYGYSESKTVTVESTGHTLVVDEQETWWDGKTYDDHGYPILYPTVSCTKGDASNLPAKAVCYKEEVATEPTCTTKGKMNYYYHVQYGNEAAVKRADGKDYIVVTDQSIPTIDHAAADKNEKPELEYLAADGTWVSDPQKSAYATGDAESLKYRPVWQCSRCKQYVVPGTEAEEGTAVGKSKSTVYYASYVEDGETKYEKQEGLTSFNECTGKSVTTSTFEPIKVVYAQGEGGAQKVATFDVGEIIQEDYEYTPEHNSTSAEVVVVPATHTEPGSKSFECTKCHHKVVVELERTTGHTYEKDIEKHDIVVEVPATCEGNSIKYKVCTECKAAGLDPQDENNNPVTGLKNADGTDFAVKGAVVIESGNPLGHSYKLSAYNFSADGKAVNATINCKNEGCKKSRVIPATSTLTGDPAARPAVGADTNGVTTYTASIDDQRIEIPSTVVDTKELYDLSRARVTVNDYDTTTYPERSDYDVTVEVPYIHAERPWWSWMDPTYTTRYATIDPDFYTVEWPEVTEPTEDAVVTITATDYVDEDGVSAIGSAEGLFDVDPAVTVKVNTETITDPEETEFAFDYNAEANTFEASTTEVGATVSYLIDGEPAEEVALTNAGEYTVNYVITHEAGTEDEWNEVSEDYTFMINRLTVRITKADYEMVVGDEDPAIEYSKTGVVDDPELEFEEHSDKVGTYSLYAVANGNYDVEYPTGTEYLTLTIIDDEEFNELKDKAEEALNDAPDVDEEAFPTEAAAVKDALGELYDRLNQEDVTYEDLENALIAVYEAEQAYFDAVEDAEKAEEAAKDKAEFEADKALRAAGKVDASYPGADKVEELKGDLQYMVNNADKYTAKEIEAKTAELNDAVELAKAKKAATTITEANGYTAASVKAVAEAVKTNDAAKINEAVAKAVKKAASQISITSKKLKIKRGKKKAIAVSNPAGQKLTFKKVKGNKKISVTADGKIKLKKKGLKKGKTYKVTVQVTAAASDNILAGTATKKIKVKVK